MDEPTPARPAGVVATAGPDGAGVVLAEAALTYSGPDPYDPTMHVWTATFPNAVADQLILGDAHLHIDALPARTSIVVDLGDNELGPQL